MYALREALIAFRRAPVLTGLSAIMIALSLFVIGLFGIAAYNIRQVIERVEARVEVVAYLHDDAAPSQIRRAIDEVMDYPEVRSVEYITREQALEIARAELREFQTVFAGLDTNPLPASLSVTLHPHQRGAHVVHEVAERIAYYPFVEEVVYGSEWLDKIFLLRRIAGVATLVLGLAFAVVGAIIIGAAIRMAIYARRDEIAIMRLVGATEEFVRRPFMIEGLITGVAGAALAWAGTYGVFRVLSGSVFELEWLPGAYITAGFVFGAVLGVLSSVVAVQRHVQELT
jgi:cell division transport system permease protein